MVVRRSLNLLTLKACKLGHVSAFDRDVGVHISRIPVWVSPVWDHFWTLLFRELPRCDFPGFRPTCVSRAYHLPIEINYMTHEHVHVYTSDSMYTLYGT